MRYLSVAALVLAVMAGGVAADPQRLTVAEMDRVTAGSSQATSYTVSETSRSVNGKEKNWVEIVEQYWDNGKLKTRRVEAVDGRVTNGDPELYRRHMRDNARAEEALRNAFSGAGLERLDAFSQGLGLGSIFRDFDFKP